jgi:hypothetical protein
MDSGKKGVCMISVIPDSLQVWKCEDCKTERAYGTGRPDAECTEALIFCEGKCSTWTRHRYTRSTVDQGEIGSLREQSEKKHKEAA